MLLYFVTSVDKDDVHENHDVPFRFQFEIFFVVSCCSLTHLLSTELEFSVMYSATPIQEEYGDFCYVLFL